MSLGLIALSSTSFAQTTVNPTFPPLTAFLWGNTSVNAVGKTAFVTGTGYGYRYITPKNFNANTKYPTIIYLHGSSEAGKDNTAQLTAVNNSGHGSFAMISTANPDNQTNFPCFYIAPQVSPNDNWSTETAATNIQNLINIFKTQYPNSFDTTRIYLTGSSLGGMGAYDLPYLLAQSTHLAANPFAATVPLSGQLGYWDNRAINTEPNLPIWAFHGALDPTMPISAGDDVDIPALRKLGYTIIFSRYANGYHDVWEVAYQHPQLLPWMFAQRLNQTAPAPLAGFAITGATQPTSTTLNLTGTASATEGYNGLSWNNYTTNQSGTGSSTMTPTWSLANIPIGAGLNHIQVTGSAPNNTALVNGAVANYGGSVTVNLPYAASTVTGVTVVSLNKPVTASSTGGTTTPASAAVDGNNTTRWASVFSDPQWIAMDLGASYKIVEVDLNWEAAAGKNYLIQTSTDNVNWITQNTITGNTTSGVHTYATAAVPTARYVRMYGTSRATGWGYSLYEFTVYGAPITSNTTPTGTSLALNQYTTVSSVDMVTHTGNMAVDGNSTTRWSSAYSDPQWIYVDLGATKYISKVTLTWETACGRNYQIQSSNDLVTWTTRTTVTGNSSIGLLTYDYSTSPFTGRYVRMYGTARATAWGYSLWDFSVYGQ